MCVLSSRLFRGPGDVLHSRQRCHLIPLTGVSMSLLISRTQVGREALTTRTRHLGTGPTYVQPSLKNKKSHRKPRRPGVRDYQKMPQLVLYTVEPTNIDGKAAVHRTSNSDHAKAACPVPPWPVGCSSGSSTNFFLRYLFGSAWVRVRVQGQGLG